MNCPVCNKKFEFEIPKEDIYYDCSYCQSSLLFSQGQCQIINAEPVDSSISEPKIAEKQSTAFKGLETEPGDIEKSADSKIFTGALEPTKTKSAFTEEIETTQIQEEQKLNKETSGEQIISDKKETEVPENEIEESEEDFYPEAKTEVPELKEELEESALPENNLNQAEDREESSYPFEENEQADSESLPEENQNQSYSESPAEENTSSSNAEKEEDFSDVAEFAKNQDADTKGIYLYDLILSEINAQNLKEEVLSVLEDSFLNLPIEEEKLNLKDVIEKGEIKIPRISPVQAYIIISSLMGLPLNIHWEQYHIADE